MKKLNKIILVVLVYGLISCEGKFEPYGPTDKLDAVTLEFPNNNEVCLEGYIEEGKEEIEVTFKWSAVEGADSYGIEVMNTTNTDDFLDREVTANEVIILLHTGTLYSWKVYSINENQETESETWSFYTQGLQVNNVVPFPAAISVVDNQGTIDISWLAEDLDNNIVGYDVYLSPEDPPSLFMENTTVTSVTNFNVTSGMQYYIVVETKDALENSSTAKTNFIAQ